LVADAWHSGVEIVYERDSIARQFADMGVGK